MNVLRKNVALRGGAIVAAASLLGICFLEGPVVLANEANNCQRMNASEFTSPDARWVAHLYGEVCDLGLMTSAAVVVDLSRVGASAGPTIVLSVSMPTENSAWPKPQWESSQSLGIRLPANSRIALRMAEFQNIAIQVHFCPSDPALREQWLVFGRAYRKWVDDVAAWSRALKSDPNGAGARPVQPKPPAGPNPESSCGP